MAFRTVMAKTTLRDPRNFQPPGSSSAVSVDWDAHRERMQKAGEAALTVTLANSRRPSMVRLQSEGYVDEHIFDDVDDDEYEDADLEDIPSSPEFVTDSSYARSSSGQGGDEALSSQKSGKTPSKSAMRCPSIKARLDERDDFFHLLRLTRSDDDDTAEDSAGKRRQSRHCTFSPPDISAYAASLSSLSPVGRPPRISVVWSEPCNVLGSTTTATGLDVSPRAWEPSSLSLSPSSMRRGAAGALVIDSATAAASTGGISDGNSCGGPLRPSAKGLSTASMRRGAVCGELDLLIAASVSTGGIRDGAGGGHLWPSAGVSGSLPGRSLQRRDADRLAGKEQSVDDLPVLEDSRDSPASGSAGSSTLDTLQSLTKGGSWAIASRSMSSGPRWRAELPTRRPSTKGAAAPLDRSLPAVPLTSASIQPQDFLMARRSYDVGVGVISRGARHRSLDSAALYAGAAGQPPSTPSLRSNLGIMRGGTAGGTGARGEQAADAAEPPPATPAAGSAKRIAAPAAEAAAAAEASPAQQSGALLGWLGKVKGLWAPVPKRGQWETKPTL